MEAPIFTFFPKKNKNTSAATFYAQNIPKAKESVPEKEANQKIEKKNLKRLEGENIQLKEENLQLKAKIDKLRKENAKKQNDLKSLLKLHKETCRMYVNNEMKYKILQKSVNLQSELLYQSFESDLGENVLKKIRKIQGEKSRDSTFILHCMRELFKNGNSTSMSAKGKRKGKSAMPSEKRDVIERIFLERLASAKLSDTEQNERFFLLDRHINVSINNMKMSNVRDFGRCRYFVFNMRVQLH